MSVKQTAGRFDPQAGNIYFLVPGPSGVFKTITPYHNDILVALNDLVGDKKYLPMVESWVTHPHHRLLIDSGTYALVAKISRDTGALHSQVFAQKATTLPGFDKLWDDYLAIVQTLEAAGAWGYIELDFGGPEGKTQLRNQLEDMGLRPIPVYHPLADPPEYFDQLAQQYDRIAFGGIVGQPRNVKKRILATVAHRRIQYPHLWIHALGVAPNDVLAAYPTDSCDASSWLTGLRWGTLKANAANIAFSYLPEGYLYQYDTDPEAKKTRGHDKGWTFGAYEGHHSALTWYSQVQTLHALKGSHAP